MTEEDILSAELESAVSATDHGIKRLRQRLGLPKKAAEKEIQRALDKGTPRADLSGRLRRVLDGMFHKHGHYGDYRVWRGWVFVFKGQRFVTVLPLTNGLHNAKAARA